MPPGPGGEISFDIFATDILDRLKDRNWFAKCIAGFFQMVAKDHGCSVTLSARRLGDAHDYWFSDAERALNGGIEGPSTELDHFKQGAFITFWLRRLVPINDIYFSSEYRAERAGAGIGSREDVTADQKFFCQYGSELCALLVGFYICLSYEVQIIKAREASGEVAPFRSGEVIIGSIRLPDQFTREYPQLLKHKNISAHAIYMLLRSLFATINWQTAHEA